MNFVWVPRVGREMIPTRLIQSMGSILCWDSHVQRFAIRLPLAGSRWTGLDRY